MTKFKIDLNDMVAMKLSFEAYFVLLCLINKDLESLLLYTRNCKKIDTHIFTDLATSGYITITEGVSEKISFSDLNLTDLGKVLIKNTNTQVQASAVSEEYEEFKLHYPKSVKVGRVSRRLHGNSSRCIKLFTEIRKEGISLETLSKCARIYTKEKIDSGSQLYMQLLETWLSKRTFEEYIDEVEDTTTSSFIDDI